jgi:3-isopropylmalate dehydratase small subunit
MKEFFKNSFARIFYDEALDTLFLEYTTKVPNDELFITVNQAVLDAFVKLKTQKFVADIRKMGIISLSSQSWVVNNLLPGMLKHLNGKKLYHAQFLDASEIMAKVSAGNIKNKSEQAAKDFEVKQFSREEELKNYLKGVLSS